MNFTTQPATASETTYERFRPYRDSTACIIRKKSFEVVSDGVVVGCPVKFFIYDIYIYIIITFYAYVINSVPVTVDQLPVLARHDVIERCLPLSLPAFWRQNLALDCVLTGGAASLLSCSASDRYGWMVCWVRVACYNKAKLLSIILFTTKNLWN